MPIAKHIKKDLEDASLIRVMFDEGLKLKAKFGPENVYDLSIGNPDLPPPEEFSRVLHRIIDEDIPNKHGYMANAGLPEVRRAIAQRAAPIQGVDVDERHVVMTVGSGGALNLAFRAIVNLGDEVVVNAPVFVAYRNYISVHRGVLKVAPGLDNFDLNLPAIEALLTKQTAAVLINSPNNPSGRIYSRSCLEALADILERKSRELGRRIYIISDEPYRDVVFDGTEVPGIPSVYPHTIICTSYSKTLSIPGERIGWTLVHPEAEDADIILAGMAMSNLNMGFTNAPALMQRAVAELQGVSVDVDIYRRRRDLLSDALEEMGYRMHRPEGAFYLFPAAPGGDDIAFCDALKKERILAVPGSGFAMPGFFRLSFCTSEDVIRASLPGFRRALKSAAACV